MNTKYIASLMSVCLLLSSNTSHAVYKGDDLEQIETQPSKWSERVETAKKYGKPLGRSFAITAACTGLGLRIGNMLITDSPSVSEQYHKPSSIGNQFYKDLYGVAGGLAGSSLCYYFAKGDGHQDANRIGAILGIVSAAYVASKIR